MVNIPPSWNRLVHFAEQAKNVGLSAQELTDRYNKAQELSAIRTAKEGGYFFTITNDFLVDNFCEEKYRDFRTVHYIKYAILNDMKIREITCLNFAMRLRICNLSGNYIKKLDPLGPCRQLIKLDVHSNQITNIPTQNFWSGMKSLQILHLHDNPLSKIDTIQFLSNCRNLQVLTLYDTPLCLRKNYRHHTVNTIWTLLVLDRHLVSDEEIIEDADFGGKFKTMSRYLELDTNIAPIKGANFAGELGAYYDVIRMVNERLAHYSPVVIIQRYYRGYATRKRFSFVIETKNWAATSIQRWWRQQKGRPILAPPPSRDRTREAVELQTESVFSSQSKPKITINLNKLNASTIEPLVNEQLALESELHTYRSEAYPQKSHLPAPLRTHAKQIANTPRKLMANFPYLNPYGSLEVVEEIDDLPRVHFRLSGTKNDILPGDALNQMIVQNMISGQQVRDADVHYHRHDIHIHPPKVEKKKFINKDQRYFSRVQGTMNLNCLMAVNRAYRERDLAEVNLAKIENVMITREERQATKKRIESEKDDRRRRARMERQKDKLRAIGTLEQQQLHSLHYLYKSQELRQRAQNFKKSVLKEQSFANDFQNQQTSISNALLRHDRQNTQENRQKSLVEFVANHRDEELEQQDLIRKYLEHRQYVRQAEVALANANLDAKLLQESTERLQMAHARVDQLRALKNKAREFCTLPENNVTTIPADDTSSRRLRGLDKWNTAVGVNRGRVGKHHITVNIA